MVLYAVLPPSHPFHKWDQETRDKWLGKSDNPDRIELIVAQPIPTEADMGKSKPKPTRKPKPRPGY